MLDIVNRLLQFDGDGYTRFRGLTISEEAAAEITQLRAELAAERELADRLAEHLGYAVNGSGEWWADESRIHVSNHESRRNK